MASWQLPTSTNCTSTSCTRLETLTRTRRSRVERLDHHLLLASVHYCQASCIKNQPHRIHYLVEAAGRAAFLSKSDDAERLLLTVLNHRHHFGRKRHLLQVQVCASCQLLVATRGNHFTYSFWLQLAQRRCCVACRPGSRVYRTCAIPVVG